MTSATERLRALLDERGVEHYDGTECTLWDYEQTSESTGCYRCSADEIRDGFVNVWMHHLTPSTGHRRDAGAVDVPHRRTFRRMVLHRMRRYGRHVRHR